MLCRNKLFFFKFKFPRKQSLSETYYACAEHSAILQSHVMTTTPTPLKQSYPSISWIVSSLHSNVYNSFIKKKMTINFHTCSDHFHRTRASTMHGATDVNQPSLKVSMKALWLTA